MEKQVKHKKGNGVHYLRQRYIMSFLRENLLGESATGKIQRGRFVVDFALFGLFEQVV